MQNHDNVIALIDEVIAAIEAEELAKFCMITWLDEEQSCGTSACIGGLTDIIIGKEECRKINDWKETASALGLNEEDGDELFFAGSLDADENGNVSEHCMADITTEHAIFALKYVREHGTVMPWVEVFDHFENGEKA